MIARAAECNPSCFSSEPLKDVERTLVPSYLRLVYLILWFSLVYNSSSPFFSHHTG